MIDLVDFCEKLEAAIAAEGSDAAVHFGRTHLQRKDNQGPGTANRVIVAPGDPEGASWGSLRVGNKVHPTTTPSEAIHSETLTLEVWGYDGSAPTNEGKQYRALRALWQCVVRAVGRLLREGGHPSDSWWGATPELLAHPIDRRQGERVRVVFDIEFAVNAPTPAQTVEAEAAPPDAEVED